MAEKTNAKPAAENAEQNVQEEKKPAVNTKKGDVKKVKEKEGIFTRIKNGIKNHKKELIAGGIGVATGVAGTIGVSEFGKRQAEKKARNACMPAAEQYSPIDPNV